MLRQQFSKYDCVPISFLNALSIFYKKIPLQLEKMIWQHSLDMSTGTSVEGIYHITNLINYNSKKIKCEFLEDTEITTAIIDNALKNVGIALIKLNNHMILILKSDKKYFYCFDPCMQSIENNINKKINKNKIDSYKDKICILMRCE